jgi:hypothetical protein
MDRPILPTRNTDAGSTSDTALPRQQSITSASKIKKLSVRDVPSVPNTIDWTSMFKMFEDNNTVHWNPDMLMDQLLQTPIVTTTTIAGSVIPNTSDTGLSSMDITEIRSKPDTDFYFASTAMVVRNIRLSIVSPISIELTLHYSFPNRTPFPCWCLALEERMRICGADLCGCVYITIGKPGDKTLQEHRAMVAKVYHINWRYFFILVLQDIQLSKPDTKNVLVGLGYPIIGMYYVSITPRKAMELNCSA